MTLAELRAIDEARTPGPWKATTIGNANQRDAAGAAFEAVMARRLSDNPEVEFSDLSWVLTPDEKLNVCLVGNGARGPENSEAIATHANTYPLLLAIAEAAERLATVAESGWTHDSEQAAWAGLRAALDALGGNP